MMKNAKYLNKTNECDTRFVFNISLIVLNENLGQPMMESFWQTNTLEITTPTSTTTPPDYKTKHPIGLTGTRID